MSEIPKPISTNRFAGGASDYLKENAAGQIASSFYFSRAVNFRDDPNSLTLLPGPIKESGSVITDLLKWGDITPESLTTLYYGNSGNIYSRTSGGVWSNLHMVAGSHGNGLAYFAGDDYLYYATDTAIGRYGPIASTSPQFVDNFLQAQGGVPQNTASLLLASASSQYASAADSASLSVTGNLTLEAFFYANTLPASGFSMTLLGKWDESASSRSYIMDIMGISGYFGTGADSSLTISSNTTEAPIDSAASATSGTQAIAATNVSFATGQVILIMQMLGANAGQWERGLVQSYTAGTITTATALLGTYTTGAQVRVLKQYTNVTVNSGVTYSAKTWNGTTGGILAFLANGSLTVTGTISGTGLGFAGGSGVGPTPTQASGSQGSGTGGTPITSMNPNGNAGGGGTSNVAATHSAGGGAGGSNQTSGGYGNSTSEGSGGIPGNLSGASDLTTMTMGGSGGGAGVPGDNSSVSGNGGNGGAIIFPVAATITVTGGIVSNGASGTAGSGNGGAGGGGAGGSILMKSQVATLGSGLISAVRAPATLAPGAGGNSGAGGDGYIVLDYLTSFTGSTLPAVNTIQDPTLVTTTSYEARLGISNDGTSFEYLTQVIPNLTISKWNRLSIAWTASISTAVFYLNGTSLGMSVGTKTSIHDNTSLLYVGADKNASAVANFFNGLVDDIRIWNTVQTAGQIFANNLTQVPTNSAGLQAYWELNSVYTDSTNSNTLTPHGSPVFSINVPFPAPTTRLDIDQSYTVTGQDYDLLTAISEATADILLFNPALDPQKSVAFNINAPGTGDWTVTVHDQQNRVIATATITNANLIASGYQEFTYPTPWRIVIGKTYHMHLTSTVADGSVVCSTDDNFATADFYTYFQFLVTDTEFHPIIPFLNFIVVGNERYLGKWDGAFYQPNFIAFPPQWRVRCFGTWREYLAVGVWRGGSITAYDRGRIYFWDGISLTFNFYIDVPEGQINAMFGVDSDLYFFAGYRAQLLDYAGGYFYNTGNSKSNKLKFIPQRAPADNFEIYPSALTMWRGILHFGIAANSTSSTVYRGTYSYGTYNQMYPDVLSYDYPLSTGNTGSTVSIGLVYPVGETLIVGWQDGIAFGADMINFSNPPAASGELDLMTQDLGALWKDKGNFKVRGDYLPLNSGESVDVKIKIDRAATWSVSPISATIGETVTEFPFLTGRGREFEIGIDLYATGNTSPTVLGLAVLNNPNREEQNF